MYGAALPDLRGSMGLLWLHPWTYGVDLWGYRSLWGFSRFMSGAAVPDQWGSMGNPDFYRGCVLGPMGRMELRRHTYGDLW